MTRWMKLALFFAVAAVLAGEPILHHHGLSERSASAVAICAVCAVGADRVTMSSPAIVAPIVASWSYTSFVAEGRSKDVASSLPSRAPPAA